MTRRSKRKASDQYRELADRIREQAVASVVEANLARVILAETSAEIARVGLKAKPEDLTELIEALLRKERRKPTRSARPRRFKGKMSPARLLARGTKLPQTISKKDGLMRKWATLAYESLSPEGHFTSGHATRDDMTKYLMESLGEPQRDRASARVSLLVKSRILRELKD